VKIFKVRKTNCATCPFRETGWVEVRQLLMSRAVNEASPICHSTGPKALVPRKKRLSAKPEVCRGARDFQLNLFYKLGFLDAPTDEAWANKVKEMKL